MNTMAGDNQATVQSKPVTSADIPRDKLGLPGAAYQCWVRMVRRGEDPRSDSFNLRDNYQVVFTLKRDITDVQGLSFERGVPGDSHVLFAKPEAQRTGADADQMIVFSSHTDANGVHMVEIRGKANREGRLGKLSVQVQAGSFSEAENIAFAAVSPFLSVLAFELDVPLRLSQLDVTQCSTQNASMNYLCPYPDMVPTGIEQNNSPYIQSLLSLYREGINSNSQNYQFLCWYKVIEGINARRASDGATVKKALPQKFPERLEEGAIDQRKRFAEIFPIIRAIGTADQNWDHIVPDEVRGWKFNRVREQKLEAIRHKIAHMLTEASGDLSLSPDFRENTREITKWLSLLRFIARVMIINESERLPKPPPAFAVPRDATTIDQLRDGVFGSIRK
jgi:hypothetical protein